MQKFCDEILQRFPELTDKLVEGDSNLPYILSGYHLINWLVSVAKPHLDDQIIRRVVDFDRWCNEQQSGKTAEDDILTIWVVGFVEGIFKYDELLPLIPSLYRKEELQKNRNYFISWVGEDRYDAAMRQRFYK